MWRYVRVISGESESESESRIENVKVVVAKASGDNCRDGGTKCFTQP